MEDAFTGSLVLTLLGVLALAYAGSRQAWRAERSFAESHGADGDRARIDGEETIAAQVNAWAATVGGRAVGRSVERWLVRAARRSAAAPPGEGDRRSRAASAVSPEKIFRARRPSAVAT